MERLMTKCCNAEMKVDDDPWDPYEIKYCSRCKKTDPEMEWIEFCPYCNKPDTYCDCP